LSLFLLMSDWILELFWWYAILLFFLYSHE
jgi:hypothetical protein